MYTSGAKGRNDDQEKKKTIFDTKISDLTDDLPNFIATPKQNNAEYLARKEVNMAGKEENSDQLYDPVCSEDTEENMETIGGEMIEPDSHTLVRNAKREEFKRGGLLRDSMVAMKEGVPGIYSGYERATRRYSKLNRPASDAALDKEATPTRPPRKARGKSDSSPNNSDSTYDRLWKPRRDDKSDESLHDYSLLGGNEPQIYDEFNEGNGKFQEGSRSIVLNSSPVKDMEWVEEGQRFDSPGNRKNRPMSAVVLPISPVEESQDSDSESEADWGSEFDDSAVNDQNEEEDELYEVIGDISRKPNNRDSVYEELNAVRAKTGQVLKTPPHIRNKPLPPIPNESQDDSLSSLIEFDDETVPYVDIIFDGGNFQYPKLPSIDNYASEDDIKRYQIIKYILENEKMYVVSLHNLIQDYEKPLKSKRIISQESVKIIFQNLQEIEQCHHLFNIALVGRMAEWDANPTIGDIIYASFSKSMALKAYTSYVKNFTSAMDRVKETCKSVPAFLLFLRTRLRKSLHKYSFYDLLKKPLGRFPQLVVLLQELLKVTPIYHGDRLPLQMALTHLECLSELICDKRRDMEMKYKVQQLDKYFTGLQKPLFSNRRYYVRHDDMLLCKVIDGKVVKTKHRRIFLLSDLLICASIINKSKAANKLSKKRYRVRWCVPVVEVNVMDVGSGIMVNIDNKTTTTIKYTHPVSSPRPGAKNVEEHLEELQHDLALIGQIAGLVASLRKSYDVIDESKVNEWYRDVKETFDEELEMANMHWLELSIPAKDKKTATCLFNLHPPQKKLEWTTELDNAKLRLAYDNNPGWYILEDETADIGNMGILRRNLPLLANKVPLFMVETKFTIECILEITPHGSMKPVLWIFSGSEHTGQITIMEMSMSSVPHVIESFVACEARILSAEVVKDEPNRFADPSEQKTLVWCGTMAGKIHIFNASSEDDREEIASSKLRDAVLCFRHLQGKVFAGIANGTLACFRRKKDMSWDFENPTIICLSNNAVMNLTEARGRLWCASGNCIYVLDVETLGIEHKIQVGNGSKNPVKHLVSYGSGVWASQWKTPKLHLYHNETLECLQSISVTTPLMRMRSDIDSRIQNVNIEKTYITAMLARGGLLWVGTESGIIVTYPLPRLGGVPQVSGRPCVSFHGHETPVRCLHAFRVERDIRSRKNTKGEIDDGIARSLFYVDRFDEAVSNIPPSFPEFSVAVNTQSPVQESEPFYFALEPEGAESPTTVPDRPKSAYEEWLKSFGENVRKVDPMFNPEAFEMRRRQDSYNSDESMDSDTEFSFIEDKAKKIPQRAKKNAVSFSVDIKPPTEDGGSQIGVVTAKNGVGGMPVIDETDFSQMLRQLQSLDSKNEPSNKQADSSGLSAEADFVVIGRSNSGYEEPIPSPDEIVTVKPYSTVNKNEIRKRNGTLLEGDSGHTKPQPTFSFEEAKWATLSADAKKATPSDDAKLKTVVKQPSFEEVEKYKSEPLPQLPDKTLYEKAREWNNSAEEGYENCRSTLPEAITMDAEEQIKVAIYERNEQSKDLAIETQRDVVDQLPKDEQVAEGDLAGKEAESQVLAEAESRIVDEKNEGEPSQVRVQKDNSQFQTDSAEEPKGDQMAIGTNSELATSTPVSLSNIPVLDLPDVEEPELEFDTESKNTGELLERNVKSPIFIKVTDMQTQASIEGAMEIGPNIGMQRSQSLKMKTQVDGVPGEAARLRSQSERVTSGEVQPDAVISASKTLPRNLTEASTPSTGRMPYDTHASKPLPAAPVTHHKPNELDLTATADIERTESIYTPLLNRTQGSDASSLSGVGAGKFDTEMALSSSLAREKLARESEQGNYATLISVSNRDDETRRELLMKPMYVVSVGSGYVDLRRKQKLSSGLDFFTKFTAADPEPKLLIWKITS